MKIIRLTLLFLLVSITSFSQTLVKKKLDSVFTVMYNQNQFNGSVLIADKGKIIFSKGYGYRDILSKWQNNPKTIFELASCAKQFTAAAIVLLHRQGLLQYEDKITKYLPELGTWQAATIYDLIRHTSGLPEYLVDMSNNWDSTKIATNNDLIKFYSQRKDTLTFSPGSMYRYSNTNYAVLASIIERVSGKSFAAFLETHIFQPLKMKHTFVYNRRQQPKKLENYATGYVWKKKSFEKVTSESPGYGDNMVYYLDGIVGNAKVNSTTSDIYKWILALKKNTFFTKEEFELMTNITKTSKDKNVSYGFGLELAKGKQGLSFGHTGSWDGYATFIYHHMGKDRTIITLQNFNKGAYPFETINQIIDGKPIKIEYPRKISMSNSQIKKFVGEYVDESNKDNVQLITFLDGHLIHNSKSIPWDMRFFPTAENQFQAIRQGGADGVLKFTDMENGDTKLEMLEYGKVIGSGIRKKRD